MTHPQTRRFKIRKDKTDGTYHLIGNRSDIFRAHELIRRKFEEEGTSPFSDLRWEEVQEAIEHEGIGACPTCGKQLEK